MIIGNIKQFCIDGQRFSFLKGKIEFQNINIASKEYHLIISNITYLPMHMS